MLLFPCPWSPRFLHRSEPDQACDRVATARRDGVSVSRFLLTIGLLITLLAAPTSAQAYTGVEADAVVEFAERGGARVPAGAPPCGAVCSDLWLSEQRPIPNQPSSRALHAELAKLRMRTSLLPKVALRAPLVGSAAWAGYKIGEGTVAKWLGLRTEPVGPASPEVSIDHGMLTEAGELLGSNNAGDLYMPYFGYLAMRADGFPVSYTRDHPHPGFLSDGCTPHTDPVPEAGGWTPITQGPWSMQVNCGTYVQSDYAFVTPFVTVGPTGQSPGGVEDYSDQPYDHEVPSWQVPWDVTVHDQVRNRALSEIDGKPQEYPTLRQWLDYHLYHPGVEDPLGIGEPNPDIEFIELDRHFTDHGQKFSPGYTDKRKYWRDAADIVERGQDGPNRDPAILRCRRLGDDPAEIYWDTDRQAWVIVKDGKIVTYYPPDRGFDAFIEECDEFF